MTACRFPLLVLAYYRLDDILRLCVLPMRSLSNHIGRFAVLYISPDIYNKAVNWQAII
jgi:hypothetical protein